MYAPGVALQVHKIVLGKATGQRRGEFPVPRFSARCVCCDATSVEQLPYDAAADDQYADRITVPLAPGFSAVTTTNACIRDELLGQGGRG